LNSAQQCNLASPNAELHLTPKQSACRIKNHTTQCDGVQIILYDMNLPQLPDGIQPTCAGLLPYCSAMRSSWGSSSSLLLSSPRRIMAALSGLPSGLYAVTARPWLAAQLMSPLLGQ
jgi:hypothetical protein